MMGWTTETFEIAGRKIEVPFAVIGVKTVVKPDGAHSSQDINQNIYSFAKTGNAIKLLSELQTQYMHCVRTRAGLKVKGHYGPIFVSNDIDPDCFAITPLGGIVINEKLFADDRALDSDGDMGLMVDLGEGYHALIKYPLTKQVPALKQVEYNITTFTNLFGELEAKQLTYDRETLVKRGRKVLVAPPIGTVDNRWDQIEAELMSLKPTTGLNEKPEIGSSYYDKTQIFLSNEQRYIELELQGLKTIRKEGLEQDHTSIGETTRLVATPETSWILGFERGKAHLSSVPFDEAVHRMRYLIGARFQKISIEETQELRPDYFPNNPSAVDKKGMNTVQRLMDRGLLRIETFEHVIPSLSFSIVKLYAPNDNNSKLVEVALTTTEKRDQTTMGYVFVIPPIIVRNPNGSFVVVPIEDALDLHLGDVDCFMPNVSQYWPRSWRDVKNNPVKALMLEKRIRDFVSKYGWSLMFNQKDVETNAVVIARNSIFFHFQSLDPKVKADFLGKVGEYINKKYGLDLVPCGGDKKGKAYTKVSVAKPKTFCPLYAGDNADPKRACQAKTPLANSTALSRKAVLVITGPHNAETQAGTSGQMFATQSGHDLAQLSNVFLNRFSTVQDEVHTKLVHYYNFAGQKLVGYIAPPQSTSPIPKLIAPCGMKNMAMKIDDSIQVLKDGQWIEPDYLLSIDEVNAKGALRWLIDRGLRKTVMTVNGTEFECAVVEINLYRTTNPSECVTPGRVTRVVTGMERHALAKVLMEHKAPMNPGPVDREYVDVLYKAIQEVAQVVSFT